MMPVVAVTLSKMRQLQLGHLFDILIPSFPIVFTSNHMSRRRASMGYPGNRPLVIRDTSCGLPVPFLRHRDIQQDSRIACTHSCDTVYSESQYDFQGQTWTSPV